MELIGVGVTSPVSLHVQTLSTIPHWYRKHAPSKQDLRYVALPYSSSISVVGARLDFRVQLDLWLTVLSLIIIFSILTKELKYYKKQLN